MSWYNEERRAVEAFEELMEFVHHENAYNEFGEWLTIESEDSFSNDFIAWYNKRKEKANEGNNLSSRTDLS